MHINPGTLSFILYGILITASIAGLVFICRMVLKSKIDNEKLDKLIDLFKTVVLTSAISTAGLIIADLFKQREYDKAEMQAFNEYIPYVVDTGSIEKKIALCNFFVAVTSDGKFFEPWKKWRQVLEDAKKANAAVDSSLIKQVRTSEVKGAPATNAQLAGWEQLEATKQKNLANVYAVEPTTYLIILSAHKKRDDADKAARDIRLINKDATIYKKRDWYRVVIPISSSWPDAKAAAAKLNIDPSKKVAYIVSSKTWCSSVSFSKSDSCWVCNVSK